MDCGRTTGSPETVLLTTSCHQKPLLLEGLGFGQRKLWNVNLNVSSNESEPIPQLPAASILKQTRHLWLFSAIQQSVLQGKKLPGHWTPLEKGLIRDRPCDDRLAPAQAETQLPRCQIGYTPCDAQDVFQPPSGQSDGGHPRFAGHYDPLPTDGPAVDGVPASALASVMATSAEFVSAMDAARWTMFQRANSSPVELTHWRRLTESEAMQTEQRQSHNHRNQLSASPPPFTAAVPNRTLAPAQLYTEYPRFTIASIMEMNCDDDQKDCCGANFLHVTFLRWVIAIFSLIGLTCIISGVILAALSVSGTTRLMLCILMISVGIVLNVVCGITWGLTSAESSGSMRWISPLVGWGLFSLRSVSQSTWSCCLRRRRRRASSALQSSLCSGMMASHGFFWRQPPPTYHTATNHHIHLPESGMLPLSSGHRTRRSPPPAYYPEDSSLPYHIRTNSASSPPSYRSAENLSETGDDVMAIANDGVAESHGSDDHGSSRSVVTYSTEDKMSVIDCSTAEPVGFEIRGILAGDGSSSSFGNALKSLSFSSQTQLPSYAADEPTTAKIDYDRLGTAGSYPSWRDSRILDIREAYEPLRCKNINIGRILSNLTVERSLISSKEEQTAIDVPL